MIETTKIACLCLFLVITFGCDSQNEPPQTPKVVTKKIATSTPPAKKPAPSKSSAQQTAAPGPMRPSSSTPQKLPVKPETPAKKIQPPTPVAQKPGPAPEKKIAAVQPPPAPVSKKTKPAAVPGEKPKEGTPAPPSQEPKAPSAADKTKPGAAAAAAKKTSETSEPGSEGEAAETDLKKMVADTAGGYSPAGKIDPFLPLFEEKPAVPAEKESAQKEKKKRRIPLTPLERVDLSQLKLVGIIQAPSGNKALVEEASGKGYIIKKGTFIGIHAGRVLEILKDRVVVEEEVENVLGQYTFEKKELKLQKPPGEF